MVQKLRWLKPGPPTTMTSLLMPIYRCVRRILIILISAFGVTNVWAADVLRTSLFDMNGKPAGHVFTFSGAIRAGDADRFAATVIRWASEIEYVNLNSLGGDVAEAIKIGRIVKAARLDTYVQAGATCASACFLVWLNGATRNVITLETHNLKSKAVIPPGRIGLHRPFLTSLSASDASVQAQANAMVAVRSYLSAQFVPSRLIDAMMARASNDIYWVTVADLEDMGDAPPELQELYVARCHDNRTQISQHIQTARQSGDEQLAEILHDDIYRINGCIADLSAHARAAAVRTGFRSILYGR